MPLDFKNATASNDVGRWTVVTVAVGSGSLQPASFRTLSKKSAVGLASCGIFLDLIANLNNSAHAPLAADFRAVVALANFSSRQFPNSRRIERRLVHRHLVRVKNDSEQ